MVNKNISVSKCTYEIKVTPFTVFIYIFKSYATIYTILKVLFRYIITSIRFITALGKPRRLMTITGRWTVLPVGTVTAV